ncbi:MAG: serine/threonine protein kinase, partial [Deltaproteobacteria bacterium]|nr:serine/threonine protein kinase [Nannocystaceae bacterium]
MSDEHEPAPPGGDNPLGGLLERARPDAGFAAQQSLQMLQSRLFGRTAQTTMVGRYTLGPRLGAGGGGTVYRALDTASGRTVAMKLLVSEGRGSSARARLLREAQSLAKLRHPNIVEFYEVGTFDPVLIDPHATHQADDGVFLAMELVEGENLATWAETEHPWQLVLEVFIAAGHGLAHAHARGFAHRDFKPSNVLVGNDGRTRVADFGLARVTRELTAPLPGLSVRLSGESSLPGLHVSLTKPGAVIGTPAYMAPEQHLSSRADARSDQFSFALALYEAVYRRSPFVGPTPGKILEAKLRGIVAPPPPGTKVPPRVYQAIVRGLAPDPAARHPSMNALLDALASDRGAPTRTRVIGAVAGVAAIAVVLAGLSLRRLVGDPCADVPSGPPGWSAEIAASLQRASNSLALGYGVNAFERVREDLDRNQGRWSLARTQVCALVEPWADAV